MAEGSSYNEFQTDWVKTADWAKSQGISSNEYLPVYQLDASRLLQNGYPMSQGERTQAILAAAGRGVTQLPSDNPNPTDVLNNVKNNLSDLFNGQDLLHMIPNLFDTAKEAITHPTQQLLDPALEALKIGNPLSDNAQRHNAEQSLSKTVLGAHAITAYVPGLYDVAEAYRGKAGFDTLADNPVTAILDVIPLSRVPLKVLAKTDTGAAIAEAAGVSKEELGDLTPAQLAWKLTKNRPTSRMAVQRIASTTGDSSGDAGLVVYKNQTTGDLINRVRNHLGAGADQAEINQTIAIHEEIGEGEKKELLAPLNDAYNKLDSKQTAAINSYMSREYHITDFRPNSEVLSDPRFTPDQSAAMEATFDLDRRLTDIKLDSGELKIVNTAAGPEVYLVKDGSRGAAVLAAKDQYQSASDALHEGAIKANSLMDIGQDMDTVIGQMFPQVKALSNNIYTAIKASLPDLDNSKVASTLRQTLPTSERLDRAPAYLSAKNNLENLLGLDERTEQRVNRGSSEVPPFSGQRGTWSDAERQAWYESRVTMLKTHRANGDDPKTTDPDYNSFQVQVRKNATARLELLGQIHEVKLHAPVSAGAARNLSEVFSPGGLVDQIHEAFDQQQHEQVRDLSKLASRKMHNKSFQSPTRSSVLSQMIGQIDALKNYSVIRDKLSTELETIWTGHNRKGQLVARAAKTSLSQLVKERDRASEKFLQTSIRNPPSVWDNYRQMEYTRLLMETDAGREMANTALSTLKDRGYKTSTLTALEQNPQSIVEMVQASSMASEENAMMPNVDPGTAREISAAADKSVYQMRSAGLKPLYLPTISPFDRIEGTGAELYNISLGRTSVTREQAIYEKSAQVTSTIYNFQAGMNKAVHEMVVANHELSFQSEDMPAFLFDRAELTPILEQYFQDELAQIAVGPDRLSNVTAFYEHQLEKMNLQSYDPSGIFSISHPKFNGRTMYIDKDFAKVLKRQMGSDNFLMKGYDKGTGVFRTSILGYSPRFTAHVVVGGGVMMAAKSDIGMIANIGNAWKMARTGRVPDEVLSKFNLTEEDPTALATRAIGKRSTQEGTGEVILQHAMSHSAAQFTLMERIASKFGRDAADVQHPYFFQHLLNVIPDANYSVTRFATHLYKSITFLEGLKSAAKDGHFYEDAYDESTGKFTRVRHDMTPQQSIRQAMENVDKVMGDVRTMTPIERNVLTRIFPFWAWTKHVLRYVFQFSSDHPYRAMFFSQLARVGLANQNSALPVRIQLLFFIGSPSPTGQVTAIDTRFANPLRDTATYASLSGWLAGLNPILTLPFSQVDPSITYGTNVMYPNITYDSIYGTNDAQQGGTPLTAAESIFPQLSTLDVALNLSGQYSYLQSSGQRNAFYKKIFDNLNIPFLQSQSLNLRQIAATNEIDRYNQAKTASSSAWSSGDFSQLQGYGQVPDPRYGTSPNEWITPAALHSAYNQTAAANAGSGLTPADVTAEYTNPSFPTEE